MTMYQECLLCGTQGPHVRIALVEWAEPANGKRFDSIPRCVDPRDCRARVEQTGEVWPLALSSNDKRGAA